MKRKSQNNNNNIFLLVLFALIIVLVFFFPNIYNFLEALKLPKISSIIETENNKSKVVDEETLSEIHYPLMRNSIYNDYTYYKLSKFDYSKMTNNDILTIAFLDMYEGNITSSNGVGTCTNISKQFDSNYLELRIKNIISKSINYELVSFNILEGSNTEYVGSWTYDSSNSKFIYDGLCSSSIYSTKYYDLTQFIKAEYDNNDIIVYYYVGFAKVEENNYTIYNDADMQNVIASGVMNDTISLNDIFKNLNSENKNKYKYIFKNNLCSYNEYCLYSGEWIND